MENRGGYGQFCPVAMAAEVLCTRWTVLLIRELGAGSSRFNELRKGVPRMSPALLSKRLKELETWGIVERVQADAAAGYAYRLTSAGQDLWPIILSMGSWGQRWLEGQLSLKNLDPSLLMWDMRRNLDPSPIPPRRFVIQFVYRDVPASKRKWWLLVEVDDVDLCWSDPGFDVDLFVTCDLRTMTAIWMGLTTVAKETEAGKLELLGDRTVARSMQQWLGLSPFAKEEKHSPERLIGPNVAPRPREVEPAVEHHT
jgi:DNA-binding HxlR family transcriptional regulator